jgi:DNA-directed RNA polymerase specialized sigma24 family protein
LRRMVGLTPTGEAPEVAVAELDLSARDGLRRFYAILDQASAEDRSLFVARFLEKMEMAEIAAAHGLSFGTAKRRMARAIDRIGRRIQRDPGLAEYLARVGGLT